MTGTCYAVARLRRRRAPSHALTITTGTSQSIHPDPRQTPTCETTHRGRACCNAATLFDGASDLPTDMPRRRMRNPLSCDSVATRGLVKGSSNRVSACKRERDLSGARSPGGFSLRILDRLELRVLGDDLGQVGISDNAEAAEIPAGRGLQRCLSAIAIQAQRGEAGQSGDDARVLERLAAQKLEVLQTIEAAEKAQIHDLLGVPPDHQLLKLQSDGRQAAEGRATVEAHQHETAQRGQGTEEAQILRIGQHQEEKLDPVEMADEGILGPAELETIFQCQRQAVAGGTGRRRRVRPRPSPPSWRCADWRRRVSPAGSAVPP